VTNEVTFTEEMDAVFGEMYPRGVYLKDIAKRIGVDRHTLSRHKPRLLEKYGYGPRTRARRVRVTPEITLLKRRLAAVDWVKVAARFTAGAIHRELAAEIGCSTGAVENHLRLLRRSGVPLRSGPVLANRERDAYVETLWQQGKRRREIKRLTGLSLGTIAGIIYRARQRQLSEQQAAALGPRAARSLGEHAAP
jgi:DNA-binding MarR family transcriptional regulator